MQVIPVPSPSVDFYLLSLHLQDIRACGFNYISFNYRVLEDVLIKLIENGGSVPFNMDWISGDDDSGGYYELQVVNDV